MVVVSVRREGISFCSTKHVKKLMVSLGQDLSGVCVLIYDNGGVSTPEGSLLFPEVIYTPGI